MQRKRGEEWVEERSSFNYMTIVVILGYIMREIQLKDAKATLSAVVDDAVRGAPAIITRHGRKEAVVLSFADYERLSHIPTFGRLLAAFPGEAEDIPDRNRTPARDVDI